MLKLTAVWLYIQNDNGSSVWKMSEISVNTHYWVKLGKLLTACYKADRYRWHVDTRCRWGLEARCTLTGVCKYLSDYTWNSLSFPFTEEHGQKNSLLDAICTHPFPFAQVQKIMRLSSVEPVWFGGGVGTDCCPCYFLSCQLLAPTCEYISPCQILYDHVTLGATVAQEIEWSSTNLKQKGRWFDPFWLVLILNPKCCSTGSCVNGYCSCWAGGNLPGSLYQCMNECVNGQMTTCVVY